MKVQSLMLGPLQTNCWIVGDEGDVDTSVVIIDPADEPERIEAALREASVEAIVLTHCHFDHLAAASALRASTGAPLLVHAQDADFITHAEGTGGSLFGFTTSFTEAADRVLDEGDVIEAGHLLLAVIHTPGHTPGSVCLRARDSQTGEEALFSGDTLFAGSVGRSDFPRGDALALRRSIAEKLASLPLDLPVHPGHGPDTTIGREARLNPFWPRA